jgi:hypothetical protein
MATSYPNNIDELINPNGSDQLSAPSHSEQHSNANDAIEALQEFVGTIESSDPNSLSYKVEQIETSLIDLDNNSDTISELLGLDGNNDLEVYGIENVTTIDSFAKNTWRSAFYKLQVTKGFDIYSSDLAVVQDGTNVLVSESNIVSTTDTNLFSYTFEETSGIINLRVAPISGSISVRFIRTAIKV